MKPSLYGRHDGPLAIAHRGGAGLAAENTLVAFARSYALGVRYLETDVRLTADGQLVAFHDATLRRVTGHRGRVAHLDFAALRQLRVHGTELIPSLAEVLDAFPDTRLSIDVKERAAIAPLARLLVARGASRRVCVAGSWDSWLAELGDLAGSELTVALGWRSLFKVLSRLHVGRVPRATFAHGTFAHVPLRLGRVAIFADDLVERAHAIGVRIVVWTVNDAGTMHRLLDTGVDGIITDHPDVLREVMIARGQWQPPESYDASVTASDLVS
ncbi:MAG: glycerophosphodiester phosphodiesterase [Actinomycetota bacterium]|nr:glycerophosphodiester phosphodiesterase [Actinomycetota bacterium]